MSYKLEFSNVDLTFKNKDEIISYLLSQVNADETTYVKLIYPDGSYIEYAGTDI